MTTLQDIQKEMDDLFEKQDQMTSFEYLSKSNELKQRYDSYKIYTNNLNLILSYANYQPRIRYFSDEYVEIRYVRNTIRHLE